MAVSGRRITELPPAADIQPSDLFVIARSRRNYRVPASMLALNQPGSGRGGFGFVYQQDAAFGPGLSDSANGIFRWSGAAPASVYALWLHKNSANGVDTSSFWIGFAGAYLMVSSGQGESGLYELRGVSISGNVVRLDVAWVSGNLSSSPGQSYQINPMSRQSQSGLVCGRPTANQAPSNGQVLAFDAVQGAWVPADPAGMQILSLPVSKNHPAFTVSSSLISIPVGILPQYGKVLGVTARCQADFSGVPGVELALGWQGDMEAYMSFIPAAAGTHDVAGFHSAQDASHELRAYFRAAQPFGNGSATYLTAGSATLSVVWVSL